MFLEISQISQGTSAPEPLFDKVALSFPLSRQHLIHFHTKLVTTVTSVLHFNTQKPIFLTSLIVSLLSPWTVLWWHHSAIKAVAFLLLLIKKRVDVTKMKIWFFQYSFDYQKSFLIQIGIKTFLLYVAIFQLLNLFWKCLLLMQSGVDSFNFRSWSRISFLRWSCDANTHLILLINFLLVETSICTHLSYNYLVLVWSQCVYLTHIIHI